MIDEKILATFSALTAKGLADVPAAILTVAMVLADLNPRRTYLPPPGSSRRC